MVHLEVPCIDDAINAMTSQMMSYLHYIMTLAGKLVKKRIAFISSKCPYSNFAHYFVERKLILKPVQTYYVWTKHYHIQRCFDVSIDAKRDKYHLKLVMFLKPSRWDQQISNSLRDLDIRQGHTRYCWCKSRGYEH